MMLMHLLGVSLMQREAVLFIIYMTMLFLSPLSRASCDNTITVVGNHAPPFRIISEGSFSGAYFDLVKQVAYSMNVTIEFQEQPFKRALLSMKSGKADLMLGPNRTSEREGFLIYTNATLGSASKAFYTANPEIRINDYNDLSGLRIVVTNGSVYFNRFDEDASLTKYVVTNYKQGIKMVALGRADALIMPESEGDYLLKILGIALDKSELVFPGKQSFITVSKMSGCASKVLGFESAVNGLKLSGTFDKIWSNYRL